MAAFWQNRHLRLHPTVAMEKDVEPGMAAFEEETFGPLTAVSRARDPLHAMELDEMEALWQAAKRRFREEQEHE